MVARGGGVPATERLAEVRRLFTVGERRGHTADARCEAVRCAGYPRVGDVRAGLLLSIEFRLASPGAACVCSDTPSAVNSDADGRHRVQRKRRAKGCRPGQQNLELA